MLIAKQSQNFIFQDDEQAPLLGENAHSSRITFVSLHIPDIDGLFTDFEKVFNPFVDNRIALENAVKAFKNAVRSIEDIKPNATFKECINTLRGSLQGRGIFLQIEHGVVTVNGAVERFVDAERQTKVAIQKIISAAERVYDMATTVTRASTNGAEKAASIDVKAIIKQECTDVKDALKALKMFNDNLKKMKKAPKMVNDFCNEVVKIVADLEEAFSGAKQAQGSGSSKVHDHGAENKKNNETSKDNQEKKKVSNGATNVDGKEKKSAYHKALTFEKIEITDIDRIFTDLSSSINPFVTNREKIQKARKSFEDVCKMICEFDAEKEFKAYLNELKEKAKKDQIKIYLDINLGSLEIKSITGVPVPKPYREAARFLNDMQSCVKELLDMEPAIQTGIDSVLKDILDINPEKDLRKALTMRDLPKLPAKLRKFNNNRKNAKDAPEIVSEFFKYVNQMIADINDSLKEE